MAAHAKSRSRIAAFTNWVAAALAAILVFGIGCVAGYQAKDSFGQPPVWIVFGGNTDTGDGNGGGFIAGELKRLGWAAEIYQVKYPAEVGRMAWSTEQAMAPGLAAYNEKCGNGCIIAGFSQGSDPAIELTKRTGNPASNLYLFGAPQPQTGFFHHYAPDSPFIAPFVQQFGVPINRQAPGGARHYFVSDDFWANASPQCSNWPVLSYMVGAVGQQHRIVGPGEPFRVWTDGYGIQQFEVRGPNPFTQSGADRSPLWIGCPWGSWKNGLIP